MGRSRNKGGARKNHRALSKSQLVMSGHNVGIGCGTPCAMANVKGSGEIRLRFIDDSTNDLPSTSTGHSGDVGIGA